MIKKKGQTGSMNLNLNNKVVIISGGAKGIGKETAKAFVEEGAIVVAYGRDEAALCEFERELDEAGYDKHFSIAGDVRDRKSIEKVFSTVYEKYGHIDILINNAGIARDKPLLTTTADDWNDIVETNLHGIWNSIQLVAPYMMKQSLGVIINISSYASKIPHAGGGVYAATKAGVSSLTKTMAAELAPYNIRVVGIIPGMIATKISEKNIADNRDALLANIAKKRLGKPEDLAKPIVFLSSEAADYISGCDIEITGGKYSAQNTNTPWMWKERHEDGLK